MDSELYYNPSNIDKVIMPFDGYLPPPIDGNLSGQFHGTIPPPIDDNIPSSSNASIKFISPHLSSELYCEVSISKKNELLRKILYLNPSVSKLRSLCNYHAGVSTKLFSFSSQLKNKNGIIDMLQSHYCSDICLISMSDAESVGECNLPIIPIDLC